MITIRIPESFVGISRLPPNRALSNSHWLPTLTQTTDIPCTSSVTTASAATTSESFIYHLGGIEVICNNTVISSSGSCF